MTPTEEIFTVAECIEGCDPSIRVKIIGKSKDRDTDCMSKTYFEGTVGEIPEYLKKVEVLCTGYSYGSQCSCICVPFGDYSKAESEESKSPILEEVTRGGFLDRVKTSDGVKVYNCTVYVIRLTPEALNDWIFSEISEHEDAFDTAEEYREYIASKKKEKEDLCKDIAEALHIKWKGTTVTQNVSEIFTVTNILKLE